MMNLFTSKISTYEVETIWNQTFAVAFIVVVAVTDSISENHFNIFFRVLALKQLSDINGSIFILLSDFISTSRLYNLLAGSVRSNIAIKPCLVREIHFFDNLLHYILHSPVPWLLKHYGQFFRVKMIFHEF